MDTELKADPQFRARKKKFFETQRNIRLAPLQEAIIEYMMKRYQGIHYRNESDFIRIAITHEAKNRLPPQEFEYLCEVAFEEQKPEVE